MIKKLINSALLLLPLTMFAQSNSQIGTYSPYSIYGLGQQRYQGGVETQAMGGLNATYSSPANINFANPASFSRLAFTTYSIGASYDATIYSTADQKESNHNVYFTNLAIGIPMGKAGGIGLSLTPYTSVGYSIYSESTVKDGEDEYQRIDSYDGNGGLNAINLGYGVRLFKGFSVGVTGSYLFGDINRNSTYGREAVLLYSRYEEASHVTGAKFDAGVQYDFALDEKTRVFLGGTYSLSSDMKSARTITTYTMDGNGNVANHNSYKSEEMDPVHFTLPQQATAGIAVGDPLKWYAGAQVDWMENPNLDGVDFGDSPAEYTEGWRYSFGGYYIPNYKSLTSYWSRVNYRFGVYYEEPGLNVSGTTIKDWGITAGIALPISSRSLSSANLVFNYGQYGTENNGLVLENYFKIGVTLSLNDKWFIKRKFY